MKIIRQKLIEEKSIFWTNQSVVENSGHLMGKQTSYVVSTNNNWLVGL